MAEEPQTPSTIRLGAETGEHDDGLSAFVGARPRLFGIAYRMLGSAAEAEDVVQDVWMRWQSTNRNVVENPPAYLATTTTRLCINLSQSAHSRRESYVGTWLPEPVDTRADPGIGAERGEALKLAVLLLLEKLSPTERAAYVLREAFDYSYDQIASILQMEEAKRPSTGLPRTQTYRRWPPHARQFERTAALSGGLYRCRPKGRHGWTGTSLRRGCCFLLRWRWTRARSGSASYRSQACSNVHCRGLHMVLEGREA